MVLAGTSAFAESVKFKDAKGDDNGPGSYTYPTDTVYTKGSFDLRKVALEDDGDEIEVTVEVGAKIKDPWDSKAWDGNGFSLQMVFIFLDTKAGGHTKTIPGLNVDFAAGHEWDKVLIISPQGNTRVQSEINSKAKDLKGDIVLPLKVKARGKKLVASFPKDKVGGGVSKSWGYQVLMQSNEGFPDKTDLLTRKVNEYGGGHRFGGGCDYDWDPHVMDMLGEQADLKAYTCKSKTDGKRAAIKMVKP
ncbi:MAG: hypothetical protein CSA66_06760 [Proteobacteria bacterium]|nr:MAG: hypothetical protein CSA66_06760 [Pseudomonadota bacterium]